MKFNADDIICAIKRSISPHQQWQLEMNRAEITAEDRNDLAIRCEHLPDGRIGFERRVTFGSDGSTSCVRTYVYCSLPDARQGDIAHDIGQHGRLA